LKTVVAPEQERLDGIAYRSDFSTERVAAVVVVLTEFVGAEIVETGKD
jgi:hypothetical protein